MLKLYVGDRLLDLPENTRIRIKRSNPAYLGEDVAVIKSTFSYPFELPMTARNRSVLGFPGRLDNADRLPTDLPARMVGGPDTILLGRLNCISAGRDRVKLFFVNNPLGDLAKININEVDMGSYTYANIAAVLTDMADSIQNPTARPWLTFPIYNAALPRTSTAPGALAERFQNSYNYATGQYLPEYPLSIFLRAEVVLKALVESVGYTWSDLFHVTDEHRRICLVNNRSITNPEGPQLLTSKYEDFLPEQKASDFIKDYCRVFGLAPFADLSGNHLTLVPLQSLVGLPPQKDWTAYASRAYSRKASPGVARFAFPEQESAFYYPSWKDLGTPDYDYEFDPGGVSLPEGLYYISSVAEYYRAVAAPTPANPNATYIQRYGGHGSVNNARGEEELIPAIGAVQESYMPLANSSDAIRQAAWSAEISYPVFPTSEEEPKEVTHTLAIYRGLDESFDDRLYPRGGINNYNFGGSQYQGDNLSLRWLGEGGLYANHWRAWDEMMKNTTAVERTFLLPISEQIGFDFRDKIRVDNKNYFVRDMEFEWTTYGVSPTQCTLIAVS